METLAKADIFFLISSVGFVILFIMLAVLLFYAIRGLRTCERILSKLEGNIGAMGETAANMLEDLRDSTIFRFLVGRGKRLKK